jgi:putative tricarboxylic transport membrane protein
MSNRSEALVGAGTAGLGLLILVGATAIPGQAGYAGVGPSFLPYVVGAIVLLCGLLLLREALTAGFRDKEPPSGAERGDWASFAWVTAGILLNAALIERIGFILSCTLCFVLAVQGLRRSQGAFDASPRAWLVAAAIGLVIASPVYWLFTKFLAINLPGLTSTGWI